MSASLLWAVPLFAQSSSPNVLFITVDDMRPELPAYGDTHIVAPNFDRLSDQGITFSRAYVQQAICQASRASIMTGTRPDTTEIYDVFFSGYPTFRDTMGLITTLPGLFKDNGYRVEGYGKNFHHQDSGSWHAENTHYTTADLYQDPVNRAIAGDPNQRPPTEAYDGAAESDYMDAKVANSAVQAIRNLAGGSQPFFLGVGFWKPHLPFAVPQSYWDLYDRTQDTHGVPGNVPISRGADALPPENAIPAQFHDPYSGELGTYKGGRPGFTGQTAATQQALADGTFDTNDQTGADYGIITVNGVHIYPEDKVREMAHGYYACVSFIDAQIGKLLDALEDPNDDGDTSDSIADNTIIVLWGDHGFHLGEDGSWPKHTNMEVAARVPFIIYEPGMTGGQVSDALVEMVDVYPTLAEMAGLPAPSSHPGLEGTSMVPLLNNPAREWKPAAFNQYPKQVPLNSGNWYMGYAMRTDTHRYVQWRPMESTDGNAISLANRNFIITNEVAYEELYDHQTDPSENINLSLDPAYAALLDAYNGMVSEALANDYANINNVSASTAEAPEALAVAFTGGSAVGESLEASYIYNDPNGDAESGTLLEWVVADDFAGPYTEVLGTGSSYTLQAADDGRYVKLRVTPGASASPTTGTSVESDWAVFVGSSFADGSSQPAPESAIYEGFDYSAGGLSSSNAGGDGWAGGWYGNPALTYAGASGAVAASKTWATPNGYGHAPNGLSGSEGTNGNTPFRELGAAHTIDLSSDTIYFSYLFHYDGTADKFEFAFSDGTGGTNPWDTTGEILKMQVKSTGELGLSGGSFSEPGFTLSTGTDYLVVGKITGNASGADRLAVSFYTASDTVPEAEPTFAYATTATSSAVLDRIKFGVSSGSNDGGVYWDELRFGTSWGAVTGTGGGTPSPSDTAPVASRLGISGHHGKGSTLTGHYLYADAESDTESGSTYRWLHASSPDGSYEAIALANGITYQVRAADVGQFLRFEVTPRSDGTVSEGSTVQSAPIYIGNSLSYGLLSHLEFDHADLSSGVIDSSGNNAGDSTVTGSLTPTTATGNAYRFDGVDDEFSLPFDGQQFDSGFTVAFWANGDPAQLPTNHALTWAISGGNDTLLIAPGWDNGDRMLIRMGESESGYEEVSYTATLDEIAGQWNHWVFSKNVAAGTIDVYLNGEQVAQGTGLHAPIVIEDHWATGAGITVGEVWNSYYPGDLDDYRIYGRALSAAEAQLLFASTDPDGVGDDLTLWRESEFSVLGGTLAPESQTGADPDADGRSNVFEFALGLDPLSPGDPNPVQVTSDGSTGVSGLRFSFPRRTGSGTGDGIDLYEVAGLRYRVKWSSDLIQWFDGSERLSLSGSPVNNGDGTETVWYESDGGADRLFIRVEVEEL